MSAPSPSSVPHDSAFLGEQADLRHGLPIVGTAGADYGAAWDRLRFESSVDTYLAGATS